MKKALLILGAFLLLFAGAAILVPVLFKDRILQEVKHAANQQLDATLGFDEVHISLFRHFPKLTVGLSDISITGKGTFAGVRLLHCKRADLAVDLYAALFEKKLVVKGLFFQEPELRIFVLKDGSANYNIYKTSETTRETTAKPTSTGSIALEAYGIRRGNVHYEDRSQGMRTTLLQLNHEGKGDFGADLFNWEAKTRIGQATLHYGGVTWINRAEMRWDANWKVDMTRKRFTMEENEIALNAFKLGLNGWLEMPNDSTTQMELTIGTPLNSVKSLLSLVPGAYTSNFEGVKTDGTVQFAGFVNGTLDKDQYPDFRLAATIENGKVQYPGMPLDIRNIALDAVAERSGGSADNLRIAIPNFNLNLGSNPLHGHFYVKNIQKDPAVNALVKGKVNLRELKSAIPFDGVTELSGMLDADVLIDATMGQLERKQYEKTNMRGYFRLTDFKYAGKDVLPTAIPALEVNLSPQQLDLRRFDLQYGNSDLKASGTIDNLLAYFAPGKTMTGQMTLRSFRLDADQMMGAPSDAPRPAPPVDKGKPVFDRWNFKVDAAVDQLVYDGKDIKNLTMRGQFTPNTWKMDQFGLLVGASDVAGSGYLNGAMGYLSGEDVLTGDISVRSNLLDLNPFMEPSTTPSGKSGTLDSVLLVPERVDLTLRADMQRVLYAAHTIDQLKGTFQVRDQKAALQGVSANILGGQMAFEGSYDTRNPARPLFDMQLALQHMDFRNAYAAFSTAQKMAPLFQSVEGRFNTALSMSSALGADMMPEMAGLNAAGRLEIREGLIKNVKALQEMANLLQMDALKTMNLNNVTVWFDISDGQVTVRPFNINVGDIPMMISGKHGLNQDMQYDIKATIPRKTLEKTTVGGAAGSGLALLTLQAKKAGVNIAQGEFIHVLFQITGQSANPKVNFKVLGADGNRSIQEEAGATLDEVKKQAQADIDKLKGQAISAADSLRREAERKADQLRQDAERRLREEVGKAAGQTAADSLSKRAAEEASKKAEEVMGEKGKKATEEARKKLEEWDPFKKKKN